MATTRIDIHCLDLPDGGEAVIPTIAEITREQNTVEDMLSITHDELGKSADPLEQGVLKSRIFQLKMQGKKLERTAKGQPDALAKCRTVSYELQKTTYAELLEFESDARVDLDTIPRIDANKLNEIVLPKVVVDYEKRKQSILPSHARKLWARWRGQVYADEMEIPFHSIGDSG